MLFTLHKSRVGFGITLRGKWDALPRYVSRILQIRHLELNFSKGWKGSDLSLLADAPALDSLLVISLKLESLAGLISQNHLIDLTLDISDSCKTNVDWEVFENLKVLCIPGHLINTTSPAPPSLDDLYIYKRANIFFANWNDEVPHLKCLRLNRSTQCDLRGIHCPLLTRLQLGDFRELRSLDGIERMPHLETLILDGCKKLESINAILECKKLRECHIIDCGGISSIKHLNSMPNLEKLCFPNTKILDGNTACLSDFKALKFVDFHDHPTYNKSLSSVLMVGRERHDL